MPPRRRRGIATLIGVAPKGTKPIASNRRARHDYDIIDEYEAGISLVGCEVKSIRAAQVQLKDAYARIEGGEAWLFGVYIKPYEMASGFDRPDPERKRKLLLTSREIHELTIEMQNQSLTLIPLSIYFKDGRAKVELGLARGRKLYDKRHAIAKRDSDRDAARELSSLRKQ